MASADLPEVVERTKKSSVMYAFICSILASMASIILGYGTLQEWRFTSLNHRSFDLQYMGSKYFSHCLTWKISG